MTKQQLRALIEEYINTLESGESHPEGDNKACYERWQTEREYANEVLLESQNEPPNDFFTWVSARLPDDSYKFAPSQCHFHHLPMEQLSCWQLAVNIKCAMEGFYNPEHRARAHREIEDLCKRLYEHEHAPEPSCDSREDGDPNCLNCGEPRSHHLLAWERGGMFDPRCPAICPPKQKESRA